MAKTRQPVKPLNQSAATVAAAAKAEKERKATSRRALRESLAIPAPTPPAETSPTPTEAPDRGAENLEAARAEAAATGMSFEEACESMGVNPTTGQPTSEEKHRYSGPMLALVAARKAYVKGTNGNPHCNDAIAQAFDPLTREEVVTACLELLDLPKNPYTHLNPGQQSMNLRNKLRHAVKNGFVTNDRVWLVAATTRKARAS